MKGNKTWLAWALSVGLVAYLLGAATAGRSTVAEGEVIKAYVVLKDGETATEQEIIDFCVRELAKFKVPKTVEFRPDLPKTMVGKVLRRVLLDEEMKKHTVA